MIFNENLGKIAEQYCKKGTKVYLEGQLQTRKWQDQSGADRYTTEVVLQRFRGELHAARLARRRRGAAKASRDEERAGPSFGRSPGADRRPALSTGGGAARADRRRHSVLITGGSRLA